MRTLIIGGNLMHPTDGDSFWRVVPDGDDVRKRAWNEVSRIDVTWVCSDPEKKGRCVVYSYGCANLWDRWHKQATGTELAIDLLVIVAGVPDSWLMQFGLGLWHAPSFVQRAVCFQVDVVPVLSPQSYPLRNDGVAWTQAPAGVVHIELPSAWERGDVRYVNVDCNELVAGRSEVAKHTTIKNEPAILGCISELLGVGGG